MLPCLKFGPCSCQSLRCHLRSNGLEDTWRQTGSNGIKRERACSCNLCDQRGAKHNISFMLLAWRTLWKSVESIQMHSNALMTMMNDDGDENRRDEMMSLNLRYKCSFPTWYLWGRFLPKSLATFTNCIKPQVLQPQSQFFPTLESSKAQAAARSQANCMENPALDLTKTQNCGRKVPLPLHV